MDSCKCSYICACDSWYSLSGSTNELSSNVSKKSLDCMFDAELRQSRSLSSFFMNPLSIAAIRDEIVKLTETNTTSEWSTENVNGELQDVDVPQSLKPFAFANTIFSSPANHSNSVYPFSRLCSLPSPPPLWNFYSTLLFSWSTWSPLSIAANHNDLVKSTEINAINGCNTEKVDGEWRDTDISQSSKPFAFANTIFSSPTNQSDVIPPFSRHSPTPLCNFSPVRHPPGYSFNAVQKRFCQTKIVELWQLLSSNIKKSELNLHGDLWLPTDEDDFTIDTKLGDCIKTILALRTPIWPPNVSKILLICVKKIPCGRDDSCLRRLRDQTRWMKDDLHNHVAAYKSFRQLKYSNVDYWYLSRHSCEFNLERFFKSPLYGPVVAEFLIRDLFHGLDYLHKQTQHLFHGNLKPSNVLIDLKSDEHLSLVLVDFGFGRLRCPRVGSLNDTRCYMNEFSKKLDDLCWKPPEFFDSTDHWSAAPKYDTPSDVYSAALLAYYMLTKRHPFVNRLDMTLMHLRRAMHEECHALECVNVEIQTIFRPLFYHDAKMRPKACDVLKQPICWTPDQRSKFLLRVADVLIRKNHLESRVGIMLNTKPCHFDQWTRELPNLIYRKIETILGEDFHSSVAALLIAFKFYREAKLNNEISPAWFCHCIPDDEYQLCCRYPTLFWDVYRTVNGDPDWKT